MIDVCERKQPRRLKTALRLVPTLAFASLVVAAALAPASANAVDPKSDFGTLFYSPQERASISAARRNVPGLATSSGNIVKVSGLIRRENGKGSAWINGRLVTEGQAVESVGVPVIDKRHITVEGHSIRVRETVDIESGARGDALPAGSVSVKKLK